MPAITLSQLRILLNAVLPLRNFNIKDMFKRYLKTEMLFAVKTPEEVIAVIKQIFKKNGKL